MPAVYLASLYAVQVHIAQKWVQTFYKKQPPKLLLKAKIFQKFRSLEVYKKGWVRPKTLNWHHYTLWSYIFSASRSTRFTESSHQSFLEVKELLKLRFLDYFPRAKTEESWSVSDKFGIKTTCSTSHYVEVNTPVSPKTATAKLI